MRSLPDRIRHSIFFEIFGIAFTAFGGAWLTGHSPEDMGLIGIVFSLLAMSWNFVYNLLFDLWDRKYRNSAPRGVFIRVIHAIFFELFMLICGMFIIAYWLNISLLDALIMDVAFSVFFLVYAFAYNWLYDIVFPIHPETAPALEQSSS